MSYDNRRKQGPKAGNGAPNYSNFGPRRPRKENIRFGTNKGKASKNNLVIDEHIQEATPEHLRIEIDKIIKEFLADPEKLEYIFPSDLNNLQRKYIHYKAQIMNIVSRSHGKEPNRQLHLKKKPRQLASQSFHVYPCEESTKALQEFEQKYGETEAQPQNYPAVKRYEKVYGRLQDSEPVVPRETSVLKKIQIIRRNLPIFDKKDVVMSAIRKDQVTIISSETGSGKTTQIPQYIMEEACYKNIPCKIICTQPRRISTIAAAERVAYERGEEVGGTVGYHIRLESKSCFRTNLLFCTVGVFLRNLMCGNQCLNNITHVIVDEIHERDKLSDFMLICLRQNLTMFPHLRVILMSATVDTTKFQEYFQSSIVLSIPGRLFPIQTYFLEEILGMTQFFTPQMRCAMTKLQDKQRVTADSEVAENVELSEQDQENLNWALEAYMNFSDDYDYTVHYEEATADLLQLFISEDVPVDQQHSEKGWTALMIACHLGDVEFVSKLCTMGASLDIFDELGKTAYDYAKITNKNNTLQLLDFMKEQKSREKVTTDTDDSQYLRQLYDMTTPDDFIDYDLIVALVKYIVSNSDNGSILIFLPGYDEIMQCNDHITDVDMDGMSYRIFFLHSSMNMKDQCEVFEPMPNMRKIILSTNIAETSITVEDVVFVIDVGKAKEKVYDSYNKLSALQTQWISRSCAKQREGRAGRVKPGFCFRLYSSQRFSHMPEERVPEILRVSLEELCLSTKIIAPRSMNIYNFLSMAPDPPTANSVAVAIENLQSLGALDKEEDLTRLGEYLAQLTLEPRLGKMLIYGCLFKCLEPILTICAGMAHKDPFQLPAQANLRTVAAAKRRELLEDIPSDHIMYVKVFQKWQEEAQKNRSKQFCRDNFISESTMNTVLETRRQLLGQLRALGFLNHTHCIEDFNQNCKSWTVVKAVMSSAFFPNIAYPIQKGIALSTRNEKRVSIHNTSVCNTKVYKHWYFFDEMVKNRIAFMVRGVTPLTPLTVSIMCGIDTVYPSSHSINIDDWLEFYFGDPLVINFRKAVHTLVEKSMVNPSYSFAPSNEIVWDSLRKILDAEDHQYELVQPKNLGARPKFLYNLMYDSVMSISELNDDFMTRNDTRQRGAVNNYSGSSTNDWVENHRKGRTPKRFIPPNKQYSVPKNSGAAKALSFNNSDSYSPAAREVSQRFHELNISSERYNASPADALLKGLGVSEDNATSYNYGEDFNRSYSNYGSSRNNSYFDYAPERNSDYSVYSNSSTYYNSDYRYRQGPSSNNGFSEGFINNTNAVPSTSGRKIVKHQDLPDFKYNDIYSKPPQDPGPSFYNNAPLDFSDNSSTHSYSTTHLQNTPLQNFYQHKANYNTGSKNDQTSRTVSSARSERFCEYADNPIFVLIRANEKRNIDIAQSCNKWVFSPQTEKKILQYFEQGRKIYLVYYVKELLMFMGIAEYKSMNIGKNFTKPTASISWIYRSSLHRNKTKHLLNPYNYGKPIFDSQDGVIIQQDIGQELMKMYSEAEGMPN